MAGVVWRTPSPSKSPLPPETDLKGLTVVGEDIRLTSEEVATATTLTANHYFVKVLTGATITLPSAVNHKDRSYTIMNMGGSAVKILGTINGKENLTLDSQYDVVVLTSDFDTNSADEWLRIGGDDVGLQALMEEKMSEVIELQRKALFLQMRDLMRFLTR